MSRSTHLCERDLHKHIHIFIQTLRRAHSNGKTREKKMIEKFKHLNVIFSYSSSRELVWCLISSGIRNRRTEFPRSHVTVLWTNHCLMQGRRWWTTSPITCRTSANGGFSPTSVQATCGLWYQSLHQNMANTGKTFSKTWREL